MGWCQSPVGTPGRTLARETARRGRRQRPGAQPASLQTEDTLSCLQGSELGSQARGRAGSLRPGSCAPWTPACRGRRGDHRDTVSEQEGWPPGSHKHFITREPAGSGGSLADSAQPPGYCGLAAGKAAWSAPCKEGCMRRQAWREGVGPAGLWVVSLGRGELRPQPQGPESPGRPGPRLLS